MNIPMLHPYVTRLHIKLDDGSEAVVDLHVAEDGRGGIEPVTRREPSIRELDVIGQALRDVRYKFYSTLG